jgi:hypothetical protein
VPGARNIMKEWLLCAASRQGRRANARIRRVGRWKIEKTVDPCINSADRARFG